MSSLSSQSHDFSHDKADSIQFTDSNPFVYSPLASKISVLCKDIIPNSQLVYYDDPNVSVTRLNLFIPSQSAGNTRVRNEIISIIYKYMYIYVSTICSQHSDQVRSTGALKSARA